MYDRARKIADQLVAKNSATIGYQDDLASCLSDIGHAASMLNDWNRVVSVLHTAAEIRSRLVAADPGRAAYHHKLGMTLRNLAVGHTRQNRPDEAVASCARAATADETAIRLTPNSPAYRTEFGKCLVLWAGIERDRGRSAVAVTLIERRCDLFPDNPAELITSAREFARIANSDMTALSPAEAAACRRAADAAVATLLAASAKGGIDYAKIRQEKVFDQVRDRLPVTSPNGK
jgi:hypothetical protein